MVTTSAPRVAVLFGTRPEIIKLAPVVDELGPTAVLIHSRQHYDPSLSDDFFTELGLPAPAFSLGGVGGADRATQIGIMVNSLGALFRDHRFDALVVQGDTNTVLAGAMAANITGIPVVHVEAGLRSNDRSMPEETNRRLTAVLADVHCAPTNWSRANLLAESVPPHAIHVTGNTVVEVCRRTLAALSETSHPATAGLGPYIVATVHRPENTDDADALRRALSALAQADLPVVFVAHPRTIAAAKRFGMESLLREIRTIEPLGYESFLLLARDAALIVSDSGGLQEETTVLQKPLLLVRRNTERPEALSSGAVRLVQPADSLSASIRDAIKDASWEQRLTGMGSPFGDGHASARIAALATEIANSRRSAGVA